jgi:acetyl-CoA synthetase
MLRGVWGDDDRYRETYWSRFAVQGNYFAGDGARYDEDGDIWLLGRVDDVMNVSGHRISTAEVESALVSHPAVAEAAVVGASDATTGQAIVAVVILRGGTVWSAGDVSGALREHVAQEIGPIAKPGRSWSFPSCPRPAPGRSCADCCGTSRRTAKSAMSPRSPTPWSWT